LSELQGNVDRVLVLDRGNLIAEGSLSALRDLSDLPVKISVRGASGLPELGPEWQELDERCAMRLCASGEKTAVLKALLPRLDPADTLQIDEPSLDDLYAHFLGGEAGQ
jgi:Cu-processing system ATP-binding protein